MGKTISPGTQQFLEEIKELASFRRALRKADIRALDELMYNTQRPHEALANLTPQQFSRSSKSRS